MSSQQRRVSASPARSRLLRDGLIALVAVAMLVAAPLVLLAFWSSPFARNTCAPSGQRRLAASADFVRAHVSDVRDLEVQPYDCDSGASAYLSFTLGVPPAAARDAFLADPTCRPDRTAEAGFVLVCGAGAEQREVFLGTGNRGSTTSGALRLGD